MVATASTEHSYWLALMHATQAIAFEWKPGFTGKTANSTNKGKGSWIYILHHCEKLASEGMDHTVVTLKIHNTACPTDLCHLARTYLLFYRQFLQYTKLTNEYNQ